MSQSVELPFIGMDVGLPLYDLWNFKTAWIAEIIKSPIHREVLLMKEAPLFLYVHFNLCNGDVCRRTIKLFCNEFCNLFMEI